MPLPTVVVPMLFSAIASSAMVGSAALKTTMPERPVMRPPTGSMTWSKLRSGIVWSISHDAPPWLPPWKVQPAPGSVINAAFVWAGSVTPNAPVQTLNGPIIALLGLTAAVMSGHSRGLSHGGGDRRHAGEIDLDEVRARLVVV